MGARAQRRVVESGMSAEAFGALMHDKKAFDAALARFVERKGEAEDAERRAGERGRGQDARELALDAREAALDLREQQLDEKIAEFGEREAAFEAWKSRYEAWMDDREVA